MREKLSKTSTKKQSPIFHFGMAVIALSTAAYIINLRLSNRTSASTDEISPVIDSNELVWPNERVHDYTRLIASALASKMNDSTPAWQTDAWSSLCPVIYKIIPDTNLRGRLCRKIIEDPLSHNLFYISAAHGCVRHEFEVKPGPIFAIAARLAQASPLDPKVLLQDPKRAAKTMPDTLIDQSLARAIVEAKKQNVDDLLNIRFLADEKNLDRIVQEGNKDALAATAAAMLTFFGIVGLQRAREIAKENRALENDTKMSYENRPELGRNYL